MDKRGRQSTMVSSSKVFLLCFTQIMVILFIASIVFQFIAVHRMDLNNNNHNHAPLNAASRRSSAVANENKQLSITTTSEQNTNNKPAVVAYVVTLTGCGDGKRYTREAAMGLVTQGAAVLRHSIALAHSSSRYDFRMYALVHPSARECSSQMSRLGYTTLIRNTPFEKGDIQKKFLREHVDGASCCGAKEYIKLYAYTLVQHPVAVILDLDSLVLRPLDGLFDVLVDGEKTYEEVLDMESIPIHVDDKKRGKINEDTHRTGTAKKRVDAFYTRDYNMVNAGGEEYAGVQGGFLVVRPSEETFEEYIDIVLEGDYREGQGWGGKYGYFFGGMQIQGICAYYYEERNPGTGVELNRCRINSMVDNPSFKPDDNKKPGQCRDGRTSCEDCRNTDISDVLSAHLTICQKPWECHTNWDAKSTRLCSQLHGEWFRIRRSFEEMRNDVGVNDNTMRQLPALEGAFRPEIYHGYCTRAGAGGYLPVKV